MRPVLGNPFGGLPSMPYTMVASSAASASPLPSSDLRLIASTAVNRHNRTTVQRNEAQRMCYNALWHQRLGPGRGCAER